MLALITMYTMLSFVSVFKCSLNLCICISVLVATWHWIKFLSPVKKIFRLNTYSVIWEISLITACILLLDFVKKYLFKMWLKASGACVIINMIVDYKLLALYDDLLSHNHHKVVTWLRGWKYNADEVSANSGLL